MSLVMTCMMTSLWNEPKKERFVIKRQIINIKETSNNYIKYCAFATLLCQTENYTSTMCCMNSMKVVIPLHSL